MIFSRIYVEEEALDNPRAKRILERFKDVPKVVCHHYGEVFNVKNQNFRIQKKAPSLIIALKKGKKVLETPEGFGVGGSRNYYFSHMQNCLYDCRYCFLQGMYGSANYVWFVNYEDFFAEIENAVKGSKQDSYFFSGYDCDSLVFESLTNFAGEFLEFFRKQKRSILELRTKSVNISALTKVQPVQNCLVAFSFTPSQISKLYEHKVPPVDSRIKAVQKLSNMGWQVGLRFDPMIYVENFRELYQELIENIFADLNQDKLHSISIGALRFPEKMHSKIQKLYPKEKLLIQDLVERNNIVSYKEKIEKEMENVIFDKLANYTNKAKIFSCSNF